MTRHYIRKEIGWLSFNQRLLQEADNPDVPLGDRVKFLGIYSSNLDEFFRVRVANMKRMLHRRRLESHPGLNSIEKALKEIREIVMRQRKWFDNIFSRLMDELADNRIHFLTHEQLDRAQSRYVKYYFEQNVRPRIFPMMVYRAQKFPKLRDNSLYLAVELKKDEEHKKYSIIEIPKKILPRFVPLPGRGDSHHYVILIDDVVRFGLPLIYKMMNFREFKAYNIKVTCDATLEMDEMDIQHSYVDKIARSVKKRKQGAVIRFVYDRNIPGDMLDLIFKKLNIETEDIFTTPGGAYHYLSDLISFGKVVGIDHYPPINPIPHPGLYSRKHLFSAIREKDMLLHFPYHSYNIVIDLLREASIDPKVESIRITLYRVGRHSSVVNALINARRNRKKVNVVLELQARFDEKANLYWADKMVSEGVKVSFGVKGLKVHSKLCLITRKEKGQSRYYSIIGTGNFNEDTAKLYTDSYLFTANQEIGKEVAQLFKSMQTSYNIGSYKHLVVSPIHTRGQMLSLIKQEENNALAGKKAFIYLKLNNFSDYQIINALYKASQSGVDIRLNVRSMFSLVPGMKGFSERIKAIGVVDKFLEHARYYIFCNDGDTRVYITSADMLPRNIDERVEVSCPIYDPLLKQEIIDIFNLQWRDTVKARVWDGELNNHLNRGEHTLRSQEAIYKYLLEKAASPGGAIFKTH